MSSPDALPSTPIPVMFFHAVPNVGDIASPMLAALLTGRKPQAVHVDNLHIPHLAGVGSIMHRTKSTSVVWGAGIMHPDIGVGEALSIRAVRGQRTYLEMRRAGRIRGDIPLGDPAVLLPRLLGVTRSATPRFTLGVAAHYVDRDHPAIQNLLRQPDVCDIDVRQEPLGFLRAMADCATVASTSLHGLVFAEAMGIPNLWMRVSDKIHGGNYKFEDWYTTTNNPQREPLVPSEQQEANTLVQRSELRHSVIDHAALLRAFPTDL
jgi:pyruvyltransferase